MDSNRFGDGEGSRRTTFVAVPSPSFIAQFTGRCHRCHERILRGARCQYFMGEVVHRDCEEVAA